MDAAETPLAIICGGGPLPFSVADSARRNGREVFLLPVQGWADATRVIDYPHGWITLGRFGQITTLARKAGARDIVFIGNALRPSLRDISLDFKTLKILPRIYRAFRGGDDHLLSGIGKIFEDDGFRLLGAHEVAPEILAPEGTLTRRAASASDIADAHRGLAVIDAIGEFDIGQAVIVHNARVLAVEAAEGTDRMLARIGELRREGRIKAPDGSGVLVKSAKPTQDRRYDLPSIGPMTVESVRAAGLAGIIVRAGDVIVAEQMRVIESADRLGIFVVGLPAAK